MIHFFLNDPLPELFFFEIFVSCLYTGFHRYLLSLDTFDHVFVLPLILGRPFSRDM